MWGLTHFSGKAGHGAFALQRISDLPLWLRGTLSVSSQTHGCNKKKQDHANYLFSPSISSSRLGA